MEFLNRLKSSKQDQNDLKDQIEMLEEKEAARQQHKSGFATVHAGNTVLLNKQVLFEIMGKRIKENGAKIEDLFLLCVAPNGNEGEAQVDTPYGKLRVFFLKDGWNGKTWLLNRTKYPYPKHSKVSTRHVEVKSGNESHLKPFERSITELANEHVKKEFLN